MRPDLYWVTSPWRGKLALSSRPRGGDWLSDEAAGWRQAGVDVVVSLLERHEASDLQLAQESESAEAQGIHYISFPIPDRGVPASQDSAHGLLHEIMEALKERKTVVVHCRQGIGRSGMIVAGLLVTSGMSVDQAVNLVSEARGREIPETAEQLEWIRRLPSRLTVVAR